MSTSTIKKRSTHVRFVTVKNGIKARFCDNRPIKDTVQELRRDGEACVNRIPKIRVFKKDGVWFSEDNRRLWCFKNANISSIPVQVVSGISCSSKFTTINSGFFIEIREV